MGRVRPQKGRKWSQVKGEGPGEKDEPNHCLTKRCIMGVITNFQSQSFTHMRSRGNILPITKLPVDWVQRWNFKSNACFLFCPCFARLTFGCVCVCVCLLSSCICAVFVTDHYHTPRTKQRAIVWGRRETNPKEKSFRKKPDNLKSLNAKTILVLN